MTTMPVIRMESAVGVADVHMDTASAEMKSLGPHRIGIAQQSESEHSGSSDT
jgi:hypothetical protein